MKRQRSKRMNSLILFKSQALTVKSIYRKKLSNGKYNVHMRFNEIKESYVCEVKNIDLLKGIKKGDLVTLHKGNGGYVCIEKGNTVPEDRIIKACVL